MLKTLFDERCIAANKADTAIEKSRVYICINNTSYNNNNKSPVGSVRSPSTPYSEIKFLSPTLRGFSMY